MRVINTSEKELFIYYSGYVTTRNKEGGNGETETYSFGNGNSGKVAPGAAIIEKDVCYLHLKNHPDTLIFSVHLTPEEEIVGRGWRRGPPEITHTINISGILASLDAPLPLAESPSA